MRRYFFEPRHSLFGLIALILLIQTIRSVDWTWDERFFAALVGLVAIMVIERILRWEGEE